MRSRVGNSGGQLGRAVLARYELIDSSDALENGLYVDFSCRKRRRTLYVFDARLTDPLNLTRLSVRNAPYEFACTQSKRRHRSASRIYVQNFIQCCRFFEWCDIDSCRKSIF